MVQHCGMDIDIRALVRDFGVIKMAKAVGITHPSVSVWTRVPDQHVRKVAALTGVPLHVLRPDLYDAPKKRGAR